MWYRLNPDNADAAAAYAADDDEDDVLAVSDAAPRSVRSKDCDLMVFLTVKMFFL